MTIQISTAQTFWEEMVSSVQKEPKELQAVPVSVPYLQWPDTVDEEFVTQGQT